MSNLQMIKQGLLEQNVGFMDRQIRAVVGAAMIIAVLLDRPEISGLWSLFLLLSIPLIGSAILAWDPIYALLGKSFYVAKEEDIQQRKWLYSNIGIVDRVLRFAIGVLLLMSVLTVNGEPAVISLVAIPFIATAIIAWDPVYALLGLNSFAKRIDAEVAEPGANHQSLAEYYQFPQLPKNDEAHFPRAA